jgi:hypothetical protein
MPQNVAVFLAPAKRPTYQERRGKLQNTALAAGGSGGIAFSYLS